MDTKLLNAKQILSCRNAFWNIEGIGLCEKLGVIYCVLEEKHLRLRSHVPPGNFGPISRILNHTFPEPSNSAAVVGALAI